MFRLKVTRIGKTLVIILPADATRALGVNEGDALILVEDRDGTFRILHEDRSFSDAMTTANSFMTRYRGALRKLAQ